MCKNTLNSVEVMKLLREAGADVNAPVADRQRRLPLHYAADYNNVEALRWLLQEGADPNGHAASEGDDYGVTPLQVAIQNGHVQAARALIDGGANVNEADACGQTPLVFACVFLARPCASEGSRSDPADDRRQRHAVLRLLLDHGADPNLCVNPDVMTPLEWARDAEDDEAVGILIASGAEK
jgi:ankyrin repeat protein